ncbi:unnamed protein product, partial [Sphacelaria rigidula]
MYELEFRDTSTTNPTNTNCTASTTSNGSSPAFTVARIKDAVNLASRLADREKLPPAELDLALAARASAHHHCSQSSGRGQPQRDGAGTGKVYRFVPKYPLDRLFPGTFYLEGVGVGYTRSYARRPTDALRARGGTLAPADKPTNAEGAAVSCSDVTPEVCSSSSPASRISSTSPPTATEALAAASAAKTTPVVEQAGRSPAKEKSLAGTEDEVLSATPSPMNGSAEALACAKMTSDGAVGVSKNTVVVAAAAKLGTLLPRVVVTGVACGLPGQAKVFEEDNLDRLLGGQGCVERLSESSMAALVEKNVVQVKRQPIGQPPLRIPISKPSQTIKLAARLGALDMRLYGVSPSIAATMDKAVKV